MKVFEKSIDVRWADLDPNRHVRHDAYYQYGAHVRIKLFAELGFDAHQLSQLNIGPILFKEECSFIKELGPSDTIRINILKGAINEDCSRWILHHEIFNQHGKCAHITVKGAWIELRLRKLAIPPKGLAEALHKLPPGEEYVYGQKRK